ncbi:Electron transfer flavoprotein, beta subunit [Moorella glycerini]|uniref:Electron transfer flavoprotein subunit beta n=1 Tax=Neomoorella stamsii TaxID=1266720 RepID=A0A9X7J627_9FIRM|nr:Electron transfer flavoprotein subunit beta [Moorella stamsii]CEP68518.1 Electron transfer flavoprotein, beta subunit [Moorella glycerini]
MRIAVLTQEQIVPVGSPIFADDNRNLSDVNVTTFTDVSDFAAMRTAVAIKEQVPGTTISLYYLGKNIYTLRHIMAVGADEATMIQVDDDLDALTSAQMVTEALQKDKFNLILTGQHGAGGDGTGQAIANFIGLTLITAAVSIEPSFKDGKCIAVRTLGRGRRQKVVFNLPALVMFDRIMGTIKYSSLPEIIRAAKLQVKEFKPMVKRSSSERIKLQMPTPRPKKIFTPDSNLSSSDRIKQILSGGISKRATDRLEGPPKDVAKQLLSLLKREGFL